MTDPFHDLYEPIRPVDPDPVFARRLRARLERALALPRGVVPVTTADRRPNRLGPTARHCRGRQPSPTSPWATPAPRSTGTSTSSGPGLPTSPS